MFPKQIGRKGDVSHCQTRNEVNRFSKYKLERLNLALGKSHPLDVLLVWFNGTKPCPPPPPLRSKHLARRCGGSRGKGIPDFSRTSWPIRLHDPVNSPVAVSKALEPEF